MIRHLSLFVLAAVLEIGGCFAFWMWLRRGAASWLAVLGVASLVGFAVVLTRIDVSFAGRAYAAYGGIYIVTSLAWLWRVEHQRPTPADVVGASLSVLGAIVILSFAARTR
jgi:small multidrug resistance family-3 protein